MLFLLPLQQSAKEINISQELRQKTSDVSTRFICNLNLRKVNLFREINHTLGSPGGQNYIEDCQWLFPSLPFLLLYSVCGSCPYCHVSTQWVEENPFGTQTALLALRSWLTKTHLTFSLWELHSKLHVLLCIYAVSRRKPIWHPDSIACSTQLANKNKAFSLWELLHFARTV